TDTSQTYGKAETRLTLFDGRWEHIGRLAYSREHDETLANGLETSESEGSKTKYAYQTNLFLDTPEIAQAAHSFTFAVEHESESVESSSAFANVDRDIGATSYVGEYRLDLLDRVFLSGSLRRDDNDKLFDDTTTFRTTGAYLHEETGTRLHGSYGTGVKNPTIFELFGFAANFVGNPNLEPEESRGWDLGLEQTFLDGDVVFDVTYFENRIEDLILGAGNTAINLDGTTEIEGVEVTARARLLRDLDVTGSYTFTKTKDSQGNDLVRRAKHIASGNVNYAFELLDRRGNLNLGVDFNGDQRDVAFDAQFNRSIVTLDGFTLVNAAVDVEVLPGVTLFARGENLLDEDYQEVLSFGTPGIAFFVGVTAKLGPYATGD
ncbi:MAG: TonB-dependent receptor, partial [Kiloniellales bacterium]|nr:TonB-dependent receptor [Kiloniellales bacterium]